MAALFERFRRAPGNAPGEWYYCLRHRTVEQGQQCPARDRFGPYGTRAEAEQALATARERDKAWQEDPRWNDDSPPSGDAGTGR